MGIPGLASHGAEDAEEALPLLDEDRCISPVLDRPTVSYPKEKAWFGKSV